MEGLNPCSNGITLELCLVVLRETLIGLNPCSNGMRIECPQMRVKGYSISKSCEILARISGIFEGKFRYFFANEQIFLQ